MNWEEEEAGFDTEDDGEEYFICDDDVNSGATPAFVLPPMNEDMSNMAASDVSTAAAYLPTFEFECLTDDTIRVTVPVSAIPLTLRAVNNFNGPFLVQVTLELHHGSLRDYPAHISITGPEGTTFIGKPLVMKHIDDFFDRNYDPTRRRLRSRLMLLKPEGRLADVRLQQSLVEMGFREDQAEMALLRCHNILDRAIDFLRNGKVQEREEYEFTYVTLYEAPLVYLALEIVDGFWDLSDHCCICGKAMDISGVKPLVCDSRLCNFQFVDIGVGGNILSEIQRDPIAVDLVISLASIAFRTHEYFNPRPPDATDEELQEFFNTLPGTKHMAALGSTAELVRLLGKSGFDLLRFFILSNRTHFVTLCGNQRIRECQDMAHQFLATTATPERELAFQEKKRRYGQMWLWHGSPIDRWHSIIHNGLHDYGNTKWQVNAGPIHGKGVYQSNSLSYSWGYSAYRSTAQNAYAKSVFGPNLLVMSLVENAKVPGLNRAIQNEWTQKDEGALIVRVLMVMKNCDPMNPYNVRNGVTDWDVVNKPPQRVPTLEEIVGAAVDGQSSLTNGNW